MIKEDIQQLFTRDLEKLHKEVAAYESEAVLWQVINGISNSGGNLCLHLLGNLNTYIGKNLGNTGYVRNRDLEFSQKNVPREKLLTQIDELIVTIEKTFAALTDADLVEIYPEEVLGKPMTTNQFLIHLAGHLNYHLGQINYHRRILGGIRSQVENYMQLKSQQGRS